MIGFDKPNPKRRNPSPKRPKRPGKDYHRPRKPPTPAAPKKPSSPRKMRIDGVSHPHPRRRKFRKLLKWKTPKPPRKGPHWVDWMRYPSYQKTGPDQPHNFENTSIVQSDYERFGISNPNWRKQVKEELNAATAMTVVVRDSSPMGGMNASMSYVRHTFDGPVTQTSSVSGFIDTFNLPTYMASPLTDVSTNANLQNKALTKLYKRLWDLDHQFQGGVFFGEIVPTWKMLIRPFSNLRRNIFSYYAALKTGRIAHPQNKWKKVLADTWLEYSFGWRPLLMDVRDASVALIRLYTNIPRSSIRVIFSEDDIRETVNFGSAAVWDAIYMHRYYRQSQKSKVIWYGVLKHLQNERSGLSGFEQLISMSGFDPRSFVPTAWELIPWSFLVDYFTNVGNLIQAYCTDLSNIRWLNRVDIADARIERWCTLDADSSRTVLGPDFRSVSGDGGSGVSKCKTIQRWVNPTLHYPGLTFNLGINGTQIANIAALAAGGQILKPFYR